MSLTKKRRLLVRTAILAVLIAAAGYTLYANATKGTRGKLQAGDQAPDFVLKDLNGKTYRLSDYKGRGVFLNFWGTWCDPCKKEMPYMNELYQTYKQKGVEILAVHVKDTRFLVDQFVKQYGLDFPVLIDKNGDVQNAYNIDPLPTTVLIAPDGKVKKIIVGNQNLSKKDIRNMMDMIKP
ncbi:thiol-disulfide oxidoreductase ResA [Weizmannia acidilactici]|uniref:Thiol-disulfide oxidoreductase ResA n=1 Tax=Weizmannia acidilactici TaxID=2607726 RepID=A0A5J4J2R1_9BACI|nr:thiol-disulfide oxidoreductase ResA [Weizmannia acidilactici]GER66063.1 thiol-disulfide oxidoreductase ResA [Weizmannia acidilactici]GER69302.1 thiol-disulfide oxidoreductase ResA [Weizmannia acidilactici]GER72372.1 thiol-disulfide oxidoreductase ResA [Weizmannia acidilactici]